MERLAENRGEDQLRIRDQARRRHTMAQEGRYEIRGEWWVVRYREPVVKDGEVKRLLRSQRLATVKEVKLRRGTAAAANGRVALGDVPAEIKDAGPHLS
jgi:hypothetical protein